MTSSLRTTVRRGAKAALPQAVALAKAFDVPLVLGFAHGANPVGGVGGDHASRDGEVGEGFLAEAGAAAKAIDASVERQPILVTAQPVEGLIALVEEKQARMLVIGGNGRGPMVGTLLGSVSLQAAAPDDGAGARGATAGLTLLDSRPHQSVGHPEAPAARSAARILTASRLGRRPMPTRAVEVQVGLARDRDDVEVHVRRPRGPR